MTDDHGRADLGAVLARHPGAVAFRFGDGPDLCADLTALVVAGRKTASCGALRDFGNDGEAMPAEGRRDVACLWDWTPAVVIETLSVEITPFDAVSRAFAEAEGEGRYADWRDGHVAYFARNGGWSPDMPLVCERFRAVEVIRQARRPVPPTSRTP